MDCSLVYLMVGKDCLFWIQFITHVLEMADERVTSFHFQVNLMLDVLLKSILPGGRKSLSGQLIMVTIKTFHVGLGSGTTESKAHSAFSI